jgi:hypothetical protein
MKNELDLHSLSQKPNFPSRWTVVLDELIPTFVKNRFSPSPAWKSKPFSQDDVAFFSKGLVELSDFFTEDREKAKLPNYFTTAKFRSSYFLYFFALQGAKFLTLFERYPKAIEAAIEHAIETGTLRIVDVGSGPGTASIAFLIFVLEKLAGPLEKNKTAKKIKLPFKIQLVWIDHNETILKDGKIMLAELFECFPEFEGDIDLVTEPRLWWKHPKEFKFEASIVLFGNVLNESSDDPRIYLSGLLPFLKNLTGAGILMVEPAFKSASQRISQIRDELMPHRLWGPCLHEGKCPLAQGRDWCHFSVPAELPGNFFKKFSIKLGSKREWLKFSFIWVAAPYAKEKSLILAEQTQAKIVRVVSDPMRTPRGNQNQLCTPGMISWFKTPMRPLYRGDVIPAPAKNGGNTRHDSIPQPRFKPRRK